MEASHCSGLSCCRAWALGAPASVFVAHGLSCPTACGILVPRPGIEPMSPVNHWTTGKPWICVFTQDCGEEAELWAAALSKQTQYYVWQSTLLAQVSQASPAAPCRIITEQVLGQPGDVGKREWVITCDPGFTWQKPSDSSALGWNVVEGELGVGMDKMSVGIFPLPFLAPGLSLVTLYSHPPVAMDLYCPLDVVKFLSSP